MSTLQGESFYFHHGWHFLRADAFPIAKAVDAHRDAEGHAFYEADYRETGWQPVTLPHTFNDEDLFRDRIQDGGSGQRRTGAGGVPATQQLLPAAHIVLKLGLFRLWWTKNSAVLYFRQAVERFDIFPGKGLCRGHGRRNAVRRNADHRVRDLLRHVQLVQGHDDRKLLLMRQLLQNGQ